MEITRVTVRRIIRESEKLRAIVSVTLDDELAVHDLKVIQGERLFVAMPSRKDAAGVFHDIVHPVGSDFRAKLEKAVLTEYEEAMLESLEDALDPDAGDIAAQEPDSGLQE